MRYIEKVMTDNRDCNEAVTQKKKKKKGKKGPNDTFVFYTLILV